MENKEEIMSPVFPKLLFVSLFPFVTFIMMFYPQMTLKFNRGKDFTYQSVEISSTADPLSYVAFSAIEYQLYELGARNGLTWEEVSPYFI